MNKLKEQIKQLVKEVNKEKIYTAEGTIVVFDNETMLADVKIPNTNGGGMFRLNKVPMQIGSGGVSQAGPFVGDKVIVSFKNGNIANPVITSLLDKQYSNNFRSIRETHSRKGALCPDNICIREDWEYSDPLYEEFIDTDIF